MGQYEEGDPKMRLSALGSLLMCLGWAGLLHATADLPNQERWATTAGGTTCFRARSVSFKGGRLLITGLQLPDKDSKPLKSRRHVLIRCKDPWDALALWVRLVGWRMKEATPFLGHEGSGRKASDVGNHAPSPIVLPAALRLTLEFVNDKGVIYHRQTVAVKEIKIVASK